MQRGLGRVGWWRRRGCRRCGASRRAIFPLPLHPPRAPCRCAGVGARHPAREIALGAPPSLPGRALQRLRGRSGRRGSTRGAGFDLREALIEAHSLGVGPAEAWKLPAELGLGAGAQRVGLGSSSQPPLRREIDSVKVRVIASERVCLLAARAAGTPLTFSSSILAFLALAIWGLSFPTMSYTSLSGKWSVGVVRDGCKY